MDHNEKNNLYAPPRARVADPIPMSLSQRPRQISVAIWLLCISFAIGYLNRDLVYPLIAGTAFPRVPAMAASFIIGIAVSMWIGRKLLLGRNWMRVTFLILFVLGLAFTPFRMARLFHGSNELLIIYVVQSVIQAFAILLMFIKPGSSWFSKRNDQ